MTQTTHECPVRGCARRVRDDRLMCGPHWKLVPQRVASRVYRTWNRGAGAGTQAHSDAVRDATRLVNIATSPTP